MGRRTRYRLMHRKVHCRLHAGVLCGVAFAVSPAWHFVSSVLDGEVRRHWPRDAVEKGI